MEQNKHGRNNNEPWFPERNMITGFTFKGFSILLALIVIILGIKKLFF